MAKLGRYSADRKKIEAVSSDLTLKAADCGTIFMLGSGSADYTITLPKLSGSSDNAGNGWWAKFTVQGGNGVAGPANTDDVIIRVPVGETADLVNINVIASQGSDTSFGVPVMISGSDGALLDLSACQGADTVELWTDSNRWYGQAIVSGTAACTKFDATDL